MNKRKAPVIVLPDWLSDVQLALIGGADDKRKAMLISLFERAREADSSQNS